MFSNSKIPEYLDRLEHDGFVEISDCLDHGILERVNAVVERPLNQLTINGKRGFVETRNTRFLFETFFWGKDIIDIYTSPNLIQLADTFVNSEVHISNHRIYRTFPCKTKKMAWHIDNKIDEYDNEQERFVTTVLPDEKGLIIIVYLSDVNDGGLQLVKGSHLWSSGNKEVWSNEELKSSTENIITFNERKKGTAIIYDYRCVHRAKPYRTGPARTSLFGQFSSNNSPTGEPILLSTSDIPFLNDIQKRVLNFGENPTTQNWPIGSKPQNIISFSKYLVNS